MKIVSKVNGVKTEHDIPPEIKCLVHQPDIRIDPLDADLIIDSRKTQECMEKMSQKAWEHISTGPLFQHLWNSFFYKKDIVVLPATIKELIEDYDIGIIHAVGLIIMLVEARFEGKKKVFVRTPEDHMHPKMQQGLMTVVDMICQIAGPDDPSTQIPVNELTFKVNFG